jgi:predicted nucleic acid-binding protein
VVGDLDLVPLDCAAQDGACEIEDPRLRTLDALHLASALLIAQDLTAFVACDNRLIAAAWAAGLAIATPGRSQPPEER